jgi:hypothetical protein
MHLLGSPQAGRALQDLAEADVLRLLEEADVPMNGRQVPLSDSSVLHL